MIKYLIPLTLLLSSCSTLEVIDDIHNELNSPYNKVPDYKENLERCEWLLELGTLEQYTMCVLGD